MVKPAKDIMEFDPAGFEDFAWLIEKDRKKAQKIKSRQLMDKIFEHVESVAIADNIDIDEIMSDMNNALS